MRLNNPYEIVITLPVRSQSRPADKEFSCENLLSRDIFSIIDQAISLGTRQLTFQCEGQIFDYPDIKQFVSYVSLHSKGYIQQMIISDGSFLLSQDLNFYKDHKVSFALSFNASDVQQWEQIYLPMLEGERSDLVLKMENLSKKFPIYLNYVVNKISYRQLENFSMLIESMKINYINFSRVLIGDPLILTAEEEQHAVNYILQIQNWINENGYVVETNIKGYLEEVTKTVFTCSAEAFDVNCGVSWISLRISAKGEIQGCHRDSERGNIRNKKLIDLWKENLEVFRDLAREKGNVLGDHVCSRCPHVGVNYMLRRWT